MKRFFYYERKAIIAIFFFFLISFPPFFAALYYGKQLMGKIGFFCWLLIAVSMICGYILKFIIIDEVGVKFKTIFRNHELNWNEIKEIGIGYFVTRGYRGPDFIYFSKKNESVGNLIHPEMVGRDFIVMQHRKKAVEEIIKYWDMPF